MFTTVEQFVNVFKNESSNTFKLLSILTDESLEQKVWEEGRTLGYLSWHIVLTLGEMMSHTGLTLDAPDVNSPAPTKASEIAEVYQKSANSLLEKLQSEWNDEKLNEVIDIYGEKWTRGYTLFVLLIHEIHHRGQLTVLMRQAGLKIIGVYGPSKEEWVNYNMPAMP